MAAEDTSAMLVTEGGQPIGSIVVSSEHPSVSLEAANKLACQEAAAAVRDEKLSSLTGDVMPNDPELLEAFPMFADDAKRKAARAYFIETQGSLDATAAKVGVPARTVAQWAYIGQWSEFARREAVVRQSQSVLDVAKLRAHERMTSMREQLAEAREIRRAAAARIREGEGQLRSNAESWNIAARVEQTLTGVSEAGTIATEKGAAPTADADGNDGSPGKGRQPLVVVFNNSNGLPPVRRV